jgi:hypothetical protein
MHRAVRGALVTAAVVTAVAAPSAQAADTRPPTTPANVRAGEVTPTTVQLLYSESTDDVGVNGYKVRGGPSTVIGSPGYAFIQLLEPGETYTFTVSAFDAAGNESAPSAPVTVTLPEWQPPTDVRVTSQSRGTVSLAWRPPANMPQAERYHIFVDGSLELITWATNATVQHLSVGSHRITVRASDWQQKLTPDSAPAAVTVEAAADSTPPTAPGSLRSVFDPDTCLYNVSWGASSDDVDDPSALVYDLLARDSITGALYVWRYSVQGTSVSRFEQDVAGVRGVDRSGNASAVTRAG